MTFISARTAETYCSLFFLSTGIVSAGISSCLPLQPQSLFRFFCPCRGVNEACQTVNVKLCFKLFCVVFCFLVVLVADVLGGRRGGGHGRRSGLSCDCPETTTSPSFRRQSDHLVERPNGKCVQVCLNLYSIKTAIWLEHGEFGQGAG